MSEIFEMMVSAAKAELKAIAGGATPGANLSASCDCEAPHIVEEAITETHMIGEKGDSFQVEVPMVRCLGCGIAYTDFRAEQLRHVAACRHLGLYIPAEIKALREKLGLSRRQFDEAYGIPPASMERWENGRIIQNRSMNTLLKALSNPATAARLDGRVSQSPAQVNDDDNVIRGRFPALEAELPAVLADAVVRRDKFKLRNFG